MANKTETIAAKTFSLLKEAVDADMAFVIMAAEGTLTVAGGIIRASSPEQMGKFQQFIQETLDARFAQVEALRAEQEGEKSNDD